MTRSRRSVRRLRSAAFVYAAAAGFGTVVAVRHDVPGEPLGKTIPVSVRVGLVIGWGAGVAAPWPMPLAALTAAALAGRDEAGRGPGVACAVLGFACVLGTLVEPVTYRRRPSAPAIRAAILANLVASTVLTAAACRFLADASGATMVA